MIAMLGGCGGNTSSASWETTMTKKTFDEYFAEAVDGRGSSYATARDAIISQYSEGETRILQDLIATAADPSDWNRQLTAQIIRGWITDPAVYETCTKYVKGDLPGPVPLPGFTAGHRIAALAQLGEAATPRILEMLWKSQEYEGDTESSALFGALAQLNDPRSIRPMLDIVEQARTPDLQTSAIRVLSTLRQPEALELLLEFVDDPTENQAVRVYSIRSLGEWDDTRAVGTLTSILLDEDASREERAAAADALETRMDPATRPAVIKALEDAWDETTVLTLVSILEAIGTTEDIDLLRRVAAYGPDYSNAATDAIAAIEDRN